MKSKLIAVSLLAATGMFADSYNNNNNNNNDKDNKGYYRSQDNKSQDYRSQDGCCPQDCCKPCCVPKPKKCIDCECYTPKFYDLQCDWGAALDVEFLYWYARETNLPYALRVVGAQENFPVASPLTFAPQGREYLHTKWDPGFRIGLGWNMECDGWDVYLSWTWMHNKKRNTTSVDNFGTVANPNYPLVGQSALLNPWNNASFAPGVTQATASVRTWDSVSANWKLWFNSIDLELGRKYYLSRCFVMRPYAGLRGAWTKTRFNTSSTRSTTTTVPVTVSFGDRFTNRYWGVGLLAGLQPTWYFSQCFALYSNLDAALIYGKFRAKKRESYSELDGGVSVVNFGNRLSDDFFMMQAIIDLAIGFRWEETWCCDRFRSALDIGWEHHIWFDHNHRLQTEDFFINDAVGGAPATKGFRTFHEATGNLGLGGLVIRLRFDF